MLETVFTLLKVRFERCIILVLVPKTRFQISKNVKC